VRAQLAFAAAALFLVLAAASAAADAPSLTVNDVTVTEGDSGAKNAVFTVVLSASSADPVTVDYATVDGSAKAPDDYAAGSGTLTFAPGELSKQVTVAVAGDTLDEPHETYSVELANPVGATIADGRGAGTILDNDPQVSLSVDDVTRSEGNGPATFSVSLSKASGKVVTVAYATADGSALAGDDYAARSGTLVFLAGDTSKSVSVPLVDDEIAEGEETFAVTLSSAVNASLADAQGVGTIVDDDAEQTPPPPPPDENPPPPPPDENPPPPPDESPPPPPDEKPPPEDPPGGEPPPVVEPPADPPNEAPDCSAVEPSPSRLWSPNHKLRLVTLGGAADADGDTVSYEVRSVTQDEPVGRGPDAVQGSAANELWLRAQRSGRGDGRVYRIEYAASDGHGNSCGGTALVGVPHDWKHQSAVDSGGSFDSFARAD
jgi:outer membrane biosynthesis protein TonB